MAGRGGRRYRVLSVVQRRLVWESFREGASTGEVVDRFGVSVMTARRMRAESVWTGRRVAHSAYRLSFAEREEILVGIVEGVSDSEIARRLGRHRSTIGREIRRCGGRQRYRVLRAEQIAQDRARRPKPCKLAGCPRLVAEVERGLEQRWSPQQISARLRVQFPDDLRMRISHEAIYQSLYVQSRGQLRRELCEQLRWRRSARRSRSRVETRGRILDRVSIAERPPEVDDRRVPGHWEGDLIIGAFGRSAVATLVERQTRYVLLAAVESQRSVDLVDVLARRIQTLPAHLARSLTWDQGKEMAAHRRFTAQTGIQVYFCDPRSPWQRGSNENTNGLLRQYLPKGSDLSVHDQASLDRIAAQLNGRPRQTLGWANPAEKLAQLLDQPPS